MVFIEFAARTNLRGTLCLVEQIVKDVVVAHEPGLQPLRSCLTLTCGVAAGWYGARRWRYDNQMASK